jgi:hypothetical protein
LQSTAFNYYNTQVKLPYGQLGPYMDWCERNCSEEWFVTESTDFAEALDGNYKFFFLSEKDYVNFILWKK